MSDLPAIPTEVDLATFPLIIFESGRYVDAAANLDSVRSILFGDLQTIIDDEPRTVAVPEGEQWDWHAEVMEASITVNQDCFGTPGDRVVRYSPDEVQRD